MYRKEIIVSLIAIFFLFSGCIKAGVQSSLVPNGGNPAGVPQPLPIPITLVGAAQAGSVVMQSDNYKTFFAINSIANSFSKGEKYQTLGFSMALGSVLQETQK